MKLSILPNEASLGTDRFWSVTELAEYLGVPVQTVYTWRHHGQGPPAHRIGRYLRFRTGDVERWLAERREVAVLRASVDASLE